MPKAKDRVTLTVFSEERKLKPPCLMPNVTPTALGEGIGLSSHGNVYFGDVAAR
jgi:hypothetical protein